MKVWKLIAGILSSVFVFVVIFQSCAAGVANALSQNGDMSGSAGAFVAMLMLAGGIVSIATRKSDGSGGNIAIISIFSIAFLLGICNVGIFSDLAIWAWWCLINVIVATIDLSYSAFFSKAYIDNMVQAHLQEKTLPGRSVDNWFYQNGNQWYGPITRNDVSRLNLKGIISSDTPVCFEGSQQGVRAGDSALRGYMPTVMLPDSSSPKIIIPTILIPLAVLFLGIVLTVGAGKRSSDNEVALADSTTEANSKAESVLPINGSSPEEMQERIQRVNKRLDDIESGQSIENTPDESSSEQSRDSAENTTEKNAEEKKDSGEEIKQEVSAENSTNKTDKTPDRNSKTENTEDSSKSDIEEMSGTVFSPQDVSDATIESIRTYGDYLDMYRFIIEDYIANYESVIVGTPLYSQEAFESQKRSLDAAFEQQNKQYGAMRNKKLVGKDDLVQFLKDYRDGLKDYVNQVSNSMDEMNQSMRDLNNYMQDYGIDLSDYGYDFNF